MTDPPSHLAIVTTEVMLFAGAIAILVTSGLQLVRIVRKSPGYLDAANPARLGDAFIVISGVALLALMVSDGFARDRFATWTWLDYLFTGLVTLDVLMSMTSTALINRALDRANIVEGKRP